MIEPLQIVEAINRLAVERIPELEQVHIDLCPVDAKRPSLTIELIDWDVQDANAAAIQINAKFTLMLLDATDDYEFSSTKRLLALQSKAKSLFSAGLLRIGDRALRVEASGAGRDFDKAYVEVSFSFFDDRPKAPKPPLMESVDTAITVKA